MTLLFPFLPGQRWNTASETTRAPQSFIPREHSPGTSISYSLTILVLTACFLPLCSFFSFSGSCHTIPYHTIYDPIPLPYPSLSFFPTIAPPPHASVVFPLARARHGTGLAHRRDRSRQKNKGHGFLVSVSWAVFLRLVLVWWVLVRTGTTGIVQAPPAPRTQDSVHGFTDGTHRTPHTHMMYTRTHARTNHITHAHGITVVHTVHMEQSSYQKTGRQAGRQADGCAHWW